MNKEDLIIEVAVYLADADKHFDYECAFVRLDEHEQDYYKGLAEITINCIQEWGTITLK